MSSGPAWRDETLRRRAEEAFSLPDYMPSAQNPDLGRVLHSLLNPEPSPGPPYTHTFTPPEPIDELEDGTLIYPEPEPAYTLEER